MRHVIPLLFLLGPLTFGNAAKCPRQRTSPGREIICYTSTSDAKALKDSICRCTTLVHQGHDLRDVSSSDIAQLQKSLKDMNPVLQFVLSVNDNEGTLKTSAQVRLETAARLVRTLNEVDGIELNVTAGTKERLVHFVQGLKTEMIRKSKEKRILMVLPTKPQDLAKQFDLKALSKYVDLFTIPTHYLSGEEEAFRTFHPSRLIGLFDMLNTDNLVDLVTGLGASKRKILISLPASVYKFTLENAQENAPRAPAKTKQPVQISRSEMCEAMEKGEWIVERDEDLTAPYAFKDDTWIAFEDKISVGIKGKYALLRDLAGLGIHNVEMDSKSQCGKSITEEVYNSFTENKRKTRQAVLTSIHDDIQQPPNSYPSHVKSSEFRIVRVVDTDGHVHANRENLQTEFSCPRQGYYVHPKSCNRFYRCVKFNQGIEDYSVFEFDCPAGLAFDERTEVCVWPGSVTEGSACPGSSEIAPTRGPKFTCPEQPGYYADPQNCRFFYACYDLGEGALTAYEFRCPYSLVFDEQKLICEWPYLVPSCGGSNYSRKEYETGSGSYSSTYGGHNDHAGSSGDVDNSRGRTTLKAGYSVTDGHLDSLGSRYDASTYNKQGGTSKGAYDSGLQNDPVTNEDHTTIYSGYSGSNAYSGSSRERIIPTGYNGQSGYGGSSTESYDSGLATGSTKYDESGYSIHRTGYDGNTYSTGHSEYSGSGTTKLPTGYDKNVHATVNLRHDDNTRGTLASSFGHSDAYGGSSEDHSGNRLTTHPGYGSGANTLHHDGSGDASGHTVNAEVNDNRDTTGYSGYSGHGQTQVYTGPHDTHRGSAREYTGDHTAQSEYGGNGRTSAHREYLGNSRTTVHSGFGDSNLHDGVTGGGYSGGSSVQSGYGGGGHTTIHSANTGGKSTAVYSATGILDTHAGISTEYGDRHGTDNLEYDGNRHPTAHTGLGGSRYVTEAYSSDDSLSGLSEGEHSFGRTTVSSGFGNHETQIGIGYNDGYASIQPISGGRKHTTVHLQHGGSDAHYGISQNGQAIEHTTLQYSREDGRTRVGTSVTGFSDGHVTQSGQSRSRPSDIVGTEAHNRLSESGYAIGHTTDHSGFENSNAEIGDGKYITVQLRPDGNEHSTIQLGLGDTASSGGISVSEDIRHATAQSGFEDGSTYVKTSGVDFSNAAHGENRLSTVHLELGNDHGHGKSSDGEYINTYTAQLGDSSGARRSSIPVLSSDAGYAISSDSSHSYDSGAFTEKPSKVYSSGSSVSQYSGSYGSYPGGVSTESITGTAGGTRSSDSTSGILYINDIASGSVISGTTRPGVLVSGAAQPGYVYTQPGTPGYVLENGVKTTYEDDTAKDHFSQDIGTDNFVITGPQVNGVTLTGDSGTRTYSQGHASPGVIVDDAARAGTSTSTAAGDHFSYGGLSTYSRGNSPRPSNEPKKTVIFDNESEGYKTNEYHDNGGRGTIRYNNGEVTHKYTEADVRLHQSKFGTFPTFNPKSIQTSSMTFTKTGQTKTGITTAELGGSGTYESGNTIFKPTIAENNIGAKAFSGPGSSGDSIPTIGSDYTDGEMDISKISAGPTKSSGDESGLGYSYPKPKVQLNTFGISGTTNSRPASVKHEISVRPTEPDPHWGVRVYNIPSLDTLTPKGFTTASRENFRTTSFEDTKIPNFVSTVRPIINTNYNSAVSSTEYPINANTNKFDNSRTTGYGNTLFSAKDAPAVDISVSFQPHLPIDGQYESVAPAVGVTPIEYGKPGGPPSVINYPGPVGSEQTDRGFTDSSVYTETSDYTDNQTYGIFGQRIYPSSEKAAPNSYISPGTSSGEIYNVSTSSVAPAFRVTYKSTLKSGTSEPVLLVSTKGYSYSKPSVKYISTTSPSVVNKYQKVNEKIPSTQYVVGSQTDIDYSKTQVDKHVTNYNRGSTKFIQKTYEDYGDDGREETTSNKIGYATQVSYKQNTKQSYPSDTISLTDKSQSTSYGRMYTTTPSYGWKTLSQGFNNGLASSDRDATSWTTHLPITKSSINPFRASSIREPSFRERTTLGVTPYSDGRGTGSSTASFPSTTPKSLEKQKGRGKVIVKFSELHPLLLGKLGAECTCKADPFATFRSGKPLPINSSKGRIDLSNYDESEVYVDLESSKENGDYYFSEDSTKSDYDNYKDETPIKSVFDRTTTSPKAAAIVSQGSPTLCEPTSTSTRLSLDIVTGRPTFSKYSGNDGESFLKKDVSRSVSYKNEPDIGNLRVGKNIGSLRDSSSIAVGSESSKFDRYGPDGLRGADETLQGANNCARPGLFRHPEYCNKFYVCHWDEWKKKFTLHVLNCPVHLTFDSGVSACNWPSKGPACQDDNLLV